MNLLVKKLDIKWEMKWHLAQNKAYLKYRNAWHQISGQLKTHDTNLVFN